MSIYYRVQSHRESLFLKGLSLKHCKEKLLKVFPSEHSDEDFISVFQRCFPCQWDDIVSYCRTKYKDFWRRKKKGLRTVAYYSPEKFLLKHIGRRTGKSDGLSEDERQRSLAILIQDGEKKKQERKEKLANNLIYVQEVCPTYIRKLIKTYFDKRKEDTLDVNARYLVLLEASQFRCKETIEFLYKINACDKNHDLRMMAFHALLRMGEHPWLSRNRKGRKRLSQIKPVDIKRNPTELIKLITDNQQLLYQEYDIFLSHSSHDVPELLRLKSILNSKGYTVYIDWVNDREMLNRENQDENTWNVLYLRMNQSKCMLYIMTDNSIQSESTAKEVLYFKNKGKKVYYYQPVATKLEIPPYIKDCKEIKQIDELLHK